MPRCQVCNKIISPKEIVLNKKTNKWELLCQSCRDIIYKAVYNNRNSPQEEQQEEEEAMEDEQK